MTNRGRIEIGVKSSKGAIYRTMASLIREANKLRFYYGHDSVDIVGPYPAGYFDPDLLDALGPPAKHEHLNPLIEHCERISLLPHVGVSLVVSDTPLCVGDNGYWGINWPQSQYLDGGVALESLNSMSREVIEKAGGVEAARHAIMSKIMMTRDSPGCRTCGLHQICLGANQEWRKAHSQDDLKPVTNIKLEFRDALHYQPQ